MEPVPAKRAGHFPVNISNAARHRRNTSRYRQIAPRCVAAMILPRQVFVSSTKETLMTWTTPRVIEIAVGMEINCYACADI
jgi:coenzyme PQQ precursor peptide PqqA